MSISFHFPFFGLLLVLTGCIQHQVALSPAPVVTPARKGFSIQSGADEFDRNWWTAFGSRELNSLVDGAVQKNLTLQQAAARIRQTQASLRQAKAAPLPQLNAEGEATDREPAPKDGAYEFIGKISLAWELDLWQRLGSATNAAKFEARAEADDYEAFRLLVAAELARIYYNAVEQQLLINLLEDQLDTNETLLELTELRFDQAGASAVDVFQQRRQLEATREQMATAKNDLRISENRLDVLLGEVPDGIDRIKRHEFPKYLPLPDAGIPANLLVTRPDLRRLRNQLVAQDYQIAHAVADRLPRIGIGTVLGYSERAISGNVIRTAIANAVLPIIDWGDRKAEVELQKAKFDESLLNFSEAYLIAIEEVENAIYSERRQIERIASLKTQRDLAEKQLSEATNRYSNGLTDYLPVLDAVQSLQRAQRDLLRQRRALLDIRILLYRALGGPLPSNL